jgi:hypothetical protein
MSLVPKFDSVGGAGAGAVALGYSRQHQAALYVLLADQGFAAGVAEITAMLETLQGPAAASDASEHPHSIIGRIFELGFAPMLHALLGVKSDVPALPVVKLIAATLPMHGPTFLGQIGFELVMPSAMELDSATRDFPALHEMWSLLCKGSIEFDLENMFYYATKAFYARSDCDVVPKAQKRLSAAQHYAAAAGVP